MAARARVASVGLASGAGPAEEGAVPSSVDNLQPFPVAAAFLVSPVERARLWSTRSEVTCDAGYMNPDVLIALVNLDEPTPEFFVDEMWSKGDPRCITVARMIVGSLCELPSAIHLLRVRLGLRYSRTDETPADGYSPEDLTGD